MTAYPTAAIGTRTRRAAGAGKPDRPVGPMLSVDDVWKSYGDVEVLRGVDLELDFGQVMCLLGPSGSGKSTLLRCINHLTPVDAGRISLEGSLIGYDERNGVLVEAPERVVTQRRRQIGMVFQHFNLFPHMTAVRNVMEGPVGTGLLSRSDAEDQARELLAKVGLGRRCDARPSDLSGGQQQRVAIARALAMRPRVMLFDEPTSALDPELVREVLDVMRELSVEGMTMIVVTHEIGFAREAADLVGFMDAGQLLELRPPNELLSAPQHPRTASFLEKVL
jgi:polar amino acid transport system ATP-binding protein